MDGNYPLGLAFLFDANIQVIILPKKIINTYSSIVVL